MMRKYSFISLTTSEGGPSMHGCLKIEAKRRAPDNPTGCVLTSQVYAHIFPDDILLQDAMPWLKSQQRLKGE